MIASSYGTNTVSSGTAQILKDLKRSPKDRHILLVEDIVDTGCTVQELCKILQARGAASVSIATLLDKAAEREFLRDALRSEYSSLRQLELQAAEEVAHL